MGTAFYPVVGEAVKRGHGSSTGGPRQALVKGMDEIALSLSVATPDPSSLLPSWLVLGLLSICTWESRGLWERTGKLSVRT